MNVKSIKQRKPAIVKEIPKLIVKYAKKIVATIEILRPCHAASRLLINIHLVNYDNLYMKQQCKL